MMRRILTTRPQRGDPRKIDPQPMDLLLIGTDRRTELSFVGGEEGDFAEARVPRGVYYPGLTLAISLGEDLMPYRKHLDESCDPSIDGMIAEPGGASKAAQETHSA